MKIPYLYLIVQLAIASQITVIIVCLWIAPFVTGLRRSVLFYFSALAKIDFIAIIVFGFIVLVLGFRTILTSWFTRVTAMLVGISVSLIFMGVYGFESGKFLNMTATGYNQESVSVTSVGLSSKPVAVGSLTCVESDKCMAIGFSDLYTSIVTNVSGKWKVVKRYLNSVKDNMVPMQLQCISLHDCVAFFTVAQNSFVVGNIKKNLQIRAELNVSSNFGRNWQTELRINTSNLTLGFTCPNTHICWASLGGKIYRSTDGGYSWSPVYSLTENLANVKFYPQYGSCISPTFCIINGLSNVLVTNSAGDSWQSYSLLGASNPVCIYLKVCYMAIENIRSVSKRFTLKSQII